MYKDSLVLKWNILYSRTITVGSRGSWLTPNIPFAGLRMASPVLINYVRLPSRNRIEAVSCKTGYVILVSSFENNSC